MARFLRKVRQGRWLKRPTISWLSGDEIQSDALLDLQTVSNKLSVYRVENEDEAKATVIALAATRHSFSNLDYVLFEEDMLASTNIQFALQMGMTPDDSVNELHYDLQNLTVDKMAELAVIVSSGDLLREPWKRIEAGVQDGIRAGTLDIRRIDSQLLEKIQRKTSP